MYNRVGIMTILIKWSMQQNNLKQEVFFASIIYIKSVDSC